MLQVVRQIKERSKVKLKRKDIKYELWRLDDGEFRKLRQKSLPIKDDYMFYIGYKDEHYFEEKYQSQSEYLAAIESLESIGISSISSQNVNEILQTITSEIVEK